MASPPRLTCSPHVECLLLGRQQPAEPAEEEWLAGYHPVSVSGINLPRRGLLRTADIARHMSVSRQIVSRSVKELVSLGLLELIEDPLDKRANVITVTAKENALSFVPQNHAP